MKKTLAVVLTMGLALAFVGCGKETPAQTTETAAEAVSDAATDEEVILDMQNNL